MIVFCWWPISFFILDEEHPSVQTNSVNVNFLIPFFYEDAFEMVSCHSIEHLSLLLYTSSYFSFVTLLNFVMYLLTLLKLTSLCSTHRPRWQDAFEDLLSCKC